MIWLSVVQALLTSAAFVAALVMRRGMWKLAEHREKQIVRYMRDLALRQSKRAPRDAQDSEYQIGVVSALDITASQIEKGDHRKW